MNMVFVHEKRRRQLTVVTVATDQNIHIFFIVDIILPSIASFFCILMDSVVIPARHHAPSPSTAQHITNTIITGWVLVLGGGSVLPGNYNQLIRCTIDCFGNYVEACSMRFWHSGLTSPLRHVFEQGQVCKKMDKELVAKLGHAFPGFSSALRFS